MYKKNMGEKPIWLPIILLMTTCLSSCASTDYLSPEYKRAKIESEVKKFQVVSKSGFEASTRSLGLRRYIKDYPDGKYVEMAESKLFALCDTLEFDRSKSPFDVTVERAYVSDVQPAELDRSGMSFLFLDMMLSHSNVCEGVTVHQSDFEFNEIPGFVDDGPNVYTVERAGRGIVMSADLEVLGTIERPTEYKPYIIEMMGTVQKNRTATVNLVVVLRDAVALDAITGSRFLARGKSVEIPGLSRE